MSNRETNGAPSILSYDTEMKENKLSFEEFMETYGVLEKHNIGYIPWRNPEGALPKFPTSCLKDIKMA